MLKVKGNQKKKKCKSHFNYTNNSNVSQALLLNSTDDWIKAINADMKQRDHTTAQVLKFSPLLNGTRVHI